MQEHKQNIDCNRHFRFPNAVAVSVVFPAGGGH